MATRMQQRRGTAAQWISTNSGNGPVLNPGEIGFETDTGKFKIGDGVSAWTSLSYFADVDTLGTALDGDFVELVDIGAASGVAGLDANKNLIVPGASIIVEGATPDSYEMTITTTDPTQDRTITLPDATGTLALTSDIPSLTGYVTETGSQTLTNKSINLANNTVSGTVAEFNTALSDANFITSTDTGTVTSTLIANETIVDGDISNTAAIAQSKIANLTTDLGNKQDKVSGVSDTEIGYLDGVTSAIQTQLDSKLASSTAASTYAPIASPTFTGTVSGVTKSMVGLGSVDNTSDANKPVSTATQTALDLKAPLASPTFTGTVTLPTGTVTSSMIADGTIVNADISASAAIDKTKISGTAITAGDTGTVTSTMIADGTIVNGDISNTAAIAWDKLAVSSTVSSTELGYLDGVTSNVQSQIDSKAALSGATFTGNVVVQQDFQVDGNFTVNGSNVIVSATQIQIEDTLLQLGHTNSSNTTDLGIFASYNDGSQKHSGLVKDVSDSGKWKLFDGVTSEPGTTVNFSQGSLDNLVVGGLEATSLTLGNVTNTEFGYLDGVTSSIQSQIDSKLASSTASSTYAPLAGPTFTGTVTLPATTSIGDVSSTELGYLDGLTSNVQAQINTKLASSTASSTYAPIASPTFTGTVTLPSGTVTSSMILDGTIVNGDISNTAAIAWDKLAVSSTVSSTELGYLDGVTSNVQAQIDTKLASSTASSTYAPIASPTFTGTVTLPSGTVTSGMILDGTIANSDISNTAAIAASKISGTAITAADTGTVTNTMLAGSIANSKLANSAVTINGSAISLGGSVTISAAPTPQAVSSNITLQHNYNYFVDTTAARSLTLPASPSLGDTIAIFDANSSAATNKITVLSNSSKINGTVQDLEIDVNNAAVVLIYTGASYGWRVG